MTKNTTEKPFRLSRRVRWLILIGLFTALLITGFSMRVENLVTRGLEYDELWTFDNYANRPVKYIFTELDVPNNHPLNSLAIKLSSALTDNMEFCIRLPAFASGLLLVLVCGWTTMLLHRNLYGIVATTAVVSLSGAAIHFSQSGRGYSMQCLFIALYLLAIIWYERRAPSSPARRWLFAAPLAIFPMLSILTLSTSVLFLFPVTCCHLLYILGTQWQRSTSPMENTRNLLSKEKPTLTAYVILTALSLTWYLANYEAFTAGQIHGQTITSVPQFLQFAQHTLVTILGIPTLVICLFALCKKRGRYITVAALIVLGFVLTSAMFLKAGPPRVYLPLLPLFSVVAGTGVVTICSLLRKRQKSLRLLVCLAISALLWWPSYADKQKLEPTDWKIAYPVLQREFSDSFYLCFPATDGYVILRNCEETAPIDCMSRTPRKPGYLVAIRTNTISGIVYGALVTKSIELPQPTRAETVGGIRCYLYRLEKVTAATPRDSQFICAISPCPVEPAKMAASFAIKSLAGEWIRLNNWLTPSGMFFQQSTGTPLATHVLARIERTPIDLELMLKMEKDSKHVISFFRVLPVSPDTEK